MTQSEKRPGRWWARSVAACSSVALAAGLVAVVAAAVDADRSDDGAGAPRAAGLTAPATPSSPDPAATPAALAAADPTGADRPAPPRADPTRVEDRATVSVVRAAPGWRPARSQDLVPVVPGRFSTTLAAGDRAVVLLGGLASRDLAGEARRLAGAFSEGAQPDGGRVVTLSDQPGVADGQRAFTSLRRTADGTLVRVTTVAAAPGQAQGRTLLAVVRPGPEQAADARAAEGIVRSLATAGAPTGR